MLADVIAILVGVLVGLVVLVFVVHLTLNILERREDRLRLKAIDQARLDAVPTEAQRLAAMHKRINNKERTAQQPLSVWQEEDGFIGTYDDEGRRCGADGQPEVAVPLGNEPLGLPGPTYTEAEYLAMTTSLGPQTVEVRQHENAGRTLYEVRIPIEMEPQRAYEHAKHIYKQINDWVAVPWRHDIAFMYGPWCLTSLDAGLSEWINLHMQYAERQYEAAFVYAQNAICATHSIPVHVMGMEQPVAHAPTGCQCGVCGPDLGPVWRRLEHDLSPMFSLNRDMIHEMYEVAARKSEAEAELEEMPENLRALWREWERAS